MLERNRNLIDAVNDLIKGWIEWCTNIKLLDDLYTIEKEVKDYNNWYEVEAYYIYNLEQTLTSNTKMYINLKISQDWLVIDRVSINIVNKYNDLSKPDNIILDLTYNYG